MELNWAPQNRWHKGDAGPADPLAPYSPHPPAAPGYARAQHTAIDTGVDETRVDDTGMLVPLEDQDRRRWDRGRISRGLDRLRRAEGSTGPYLPQAVIAALHATAPSWEQTDWLAICAAYDRLLQMTDSPVVRANRALAVGFRDGPDAGLAALDKVIALGGERGPYALQAAIAACHARAFRSDDTDWARIVALYGVLADVMPSPVVELNRAVAVGMAYGPAAGLAIVDQLAAEPALAGYHLLPSVRGDLLSKLGRHDEAQAEFERAAALSRNERERRLSAERAVAAHEAQSAQ